MTGKSLQLKHLTISGYRGVSNAVGQELQLGDLSFRNVFIGQNNGGKSTVYRFLLEAVQHLAGMGTTFQQGGVGQGDQNLFWQQNDQCEARGVLTFTSPGEDFARVEQPVPGGAVVRNGEWRMSVRIHLEGGKQVLLTVCPQAWVDAKQDWLDVILRPGPQGGDLQYLNSNGEYTKQNAQQQSTFFTAAKPLGQPVKEWAAAGRFFDPFRSLHRGIQGNQPTQGSQFLEDGSLVLHRLFEWQNDHARSASFHRFKNRFIRRINRLFDHPFAEIAVRSAPSMDLSLRLDAPDAIPIPLQSMGSGIAQMVIILASLEADAEKPMESYHYHLEEPELHLHPRLLRRFMAQLTEYKNAQFFISSHSNVVLDTIREGDRVYWFSQQPAGNCLARPADGVVEQHAILDALGVSGSTLLQANCVIWVEGPSDRLYLRRWLTEIAAEKKVELLEGADYSFVFYGGKVLSHFGFDIEDSDLEDLISMLAVSRYSAVVMDRDRPQGEPEQPLSDAKQKICEAAAQDLTHRLACVTVGREIENDLPLEAFKDGIAKKLGKSLGLLDSLVLTGQQRYPDEVLAHLRLAEAEAKTVKRKLEDKVGLAASVLNRMDEQGKAFPSRPAYIDPLFEFIRKSRVE